MHMSGVVKETESLLLLDMRWKQTEKAGLF